VLAARNTIRPYLPATPLYAYPALDRFTGLELYVKHENHAPIGSFNAPRALNALAAHRGRGHAVAASTGNHGLGVAYAARLLGMRATIVVPRWANREKLDAIEAVGGEVVVAGETLQETQQRAQELAEARGAYLAADGADPLIAAGAGTVGLEIVEALPDLDVLVVPLGDGALAAGCGAVVRAPSPAARTLGVQSEACPALVLSWQRGEVVRVEGTTLADGLAVVQPHALSVRLLRELLDEALLVSEQDLIEAIRLLLRFTHNLSEGAGAAALAACLKRRAALAGRKVAIILSGGNLDTRLLPSILGERA